MLSLIHFLGRLNKNMSIVDMFWFNLDTFRICTYCQKLPTGSFRMNDFFNTPYKSFQKCFLRLILVEKSSLVHDIWWIYAPFNIMSLWKKSMDIWNIFHFNKCCKNTLKIILQRVSLFCQYLCNHSSDLYEILNLSSKNSNWTLANEHKFKIS